MPGVVRLILVTVVVWAAASAPVALAKCAGRDLMAALALENPAAHAEILGRAHEVPNGRGRLWEVRREGLAPSHLYGTLHSTAAAERWLPTPAVEALASARMLMVELAPEEQARLEARLTDDPAYAIDTEGPGLSGRLTAEELALAEGVLARRGMSLLVAERLKPWLLISTIAVPICEQRQLAAGKRLLDDAIAAEAAAWGVPIRGLETFEQTFGAFDDLSQREITALLVDGFASAEIEEDLRRTLEELYVDDEIAAIMEFNIWHAEQAGRVEDARAGAEALERALIVGRNRNWMETLVPELEKGGVFAAFGALHLPGPGGVVALLREAGFTVSRIEID